MPAAVRAADEPGVHAAEGRSADGDTDAIVREAHFVEHGMRRAAIDHFPGGAQVHAAVDVATGPGHQSDARAVEVHGVALVSVIGPFRPGIPSIGAADHVAPCPTSEEY